MAHSFEEYDFPIPARYPTAKIVIKNFKPEI
jgi:hypothetical protein